MKTNIIDPFHRTSLLTGIVKCFNPRPTDDLDGSIASENAQVHVFAASPESVLAGWILPSIVEARGAGVRTNVNPTGSDFELSFGGIEEEAVALYAIAVDREDKRGNAEKEGWEELHGEIWWKFCFLYEGKHHGFET